MKGALSVIGFLLVILYPLGIYFGLTYLEPRVVAILLIVAALLKVMNPGKVSNRKQTLVLIVLIGVIALFTVVSNSAYGLKLYPVLVNFSFFSTFVYSLIKPPTMIERFARMQEPDLSPKAIAYTRTVTKLWCVFFMLNGFIALYTGLYSSVEVWTLYNGLIAYCLIGSLVAGEFVYRKVFLK